MKRTAFAGLFISAALLASPVFAADNDLCTSKLQELKDKVTSLPATSENTTMDIKRMQGDAEMAQKAGDDKKCIASATQALQRVDNLANEPAN
ncbi:hypothetical protein K5E40_10125 [Pseudomonas baetica]|jgi:outer membrane murein-binding lipoprotein Lpp|uniref:hypothetical protein n=1 Tax=Pseudomonas TaxID=286 RepID=UPI001C8BFD5C|nr:hypothetical protein [Pseudomonas baetica]MBX9406033.1 hypothetical protein [Pseudomonas baetica]